MGVDRVLGRRKNEGDVRNKMRRGEATGKEKTSPLPARQTSVDIMPSNRVGVGMGLMILNVTLTHQIRSYRDSETTDIRVARKSSKREDRQEADRNN